MRKNWKNTIIQYFYHGATEGQQKCVPIQIIIEIIWLICHTVKSNDFWWRYISAILSTSLACRKPHFKYWHRNTMNRL